MLSMHMDPPLTDTTDGTTPAVVVPTHLVSDTRGLLNTIQPFEHSTTTNKLGGPGLWRAAGNRAPSSEGLMKESHGLAGIFCIVYGSVSDFDFCDKRNDS